MSNNITDILIINLNNLNYTKNIVDDIFRQDSKDYHLTIIDNGSIEPNTDIYLKTIPNITYIKNDYNKPINHIWNDFVDKSDCDYICLLNNDVNIAPNFISSNVELFQREEKVAIINHPTNRIDYSSYSKELQYDIIKMCYRQGWDMTFRRELYTHIPNELEFYFGDDYIYSKIYEKGYYGAYVLNSPMIHYCSKTTPDKGGKVYQKDGLMDIKYYYQLNLKYKTNQEFINIYSDYYPQYTKINKKNV